MLSHQNESIPISLPFRRSEHCAPKVILHVLADVTLVRCRQHPCDTCDILPLLFTTIIARSLVMITPTMIIMIFYMHFKHPLVGND